jgi:Tol biopolymer transport system component
MAGRLASGRYLGKAVRRSNYRTRWRGAEVSWDGKLLAYTIQDDQTKRNRLHVVRFDNGAPFKTFDLPGKAGKFNWSPDARALVYVYTAGGVSNLWRLPLDGARAEPFTDFKSDTIRTFSYARDGRQLALARHHTTRDAVLISDEK